MHLLGAGLLQSESGASPRPQRGWCVNPSPDSGAMRHPVAGAVEPRQTFKLWPALREAVRGTERDYTTGPIGRAVLLLAVPDAVMGRLIPDLPAEAAAQPR